MNDLMETPGRVAEILAGIEQMRIRQAGGEFCAIEHVCHLRDIEAEGYSVRIAQLLGEDDPLLRDLDGEALARERRYIDQDPQSALRDFTSARARSVDLLRGADERDLAREGLFENTGRVTLARLVEMMREHDRGHLRDLETLAALERFAAKRDVFRAELESLCRIPGISASAPAEVRRSAEEVARVLERHGIGDVRVLDIEGAHPSVYGAVPAGANAPTVLLYGHHDVQPTGDLGRWLSPPFEPVERDGRLFARGACDDKGGVVAHIAAVASYGRALPCNVKFFIEGEEEIGSPNLPRFLERYRDLLRADCVVLADTPNYDTGIPALTQSLRGMCVIDIEVRCLERPLHSGRGGGAAPDAIAILCQVIAEFGGPTGLPPAGGKAARLHHDLGLLEGVSLLGTRESTWNEPAITVIGVDAPSVDQAFNQIAASARARLSVRTVPPRPSAESGEAIAARIRAMATPYAIVTANVLNSVPWWRTDATGPVFDAARRALTRGYGRDTRMIGAGGSIGFVSMFEEAFPRVPLLLMGVEDPPCNAHSENESLHLGDWERCARSAIFFYDEMSR
jgi:acetylornithine deacetylase/succinyl-diaminopimelate desuccinylase-like protein